MGVGDGGTTLGLFVFCFAQPKMFRGKSLRDTGRYVRGLEEKLRRLENTAAVDERPTPSAGEMTVLFSDSQPYADFQMGNTVLLDQECSSPRSAYGSEAANASTAADNAEGPIREPRLGSRAAPGQSPTFAEELTTLSLEATAERHLGSTSGLSFAKLTQMILRRLTPDKADFVFISHQDNTANAAGNALSDINSPSELFNDTFFRSLSESISVHPLLFGDLFFADLAGPNVALDSMTLLSDEAHVQRLVDFYFAHSHTLYPILKRAEVIDTLQKIRHNSENLAAQSPLKLFRIWMVLAIGSTAYSSVTLTEESESISFYNKALQYSEQILGSDEMVRVITSGNS